MVAACLGVFTHQGDKFVLQLVVQTSDHHLHGVADLSDALILRSSDGLYVPLLTHGREHTPMHKLNNKRCFNTSLKLAHKISTQLVDRWLNSRDLSLLRKTGNIHGNSITFYVHDLIMTVINTGLILCLFSARINILDGISPSSWLLINKNHKYEKKFEMCTIKLVQLQKQKCTQGQANQVI